jgi:predicted glycosyltransferase
MVERLRKKHNVLCTSRSFNEVIKLAKIRNFDLVIVGKYGGLEKDRKLEASIDRMKKISSVIREFSPQLTISFCSPEAARISFGLGIKHIAFCDSPHADFVMRLTLPLIQKLLIPWIIPKEKFSKYGIDKKNIVSYKAIDASVTIKRNVIKKEIQYLKTNKKNILIRLEEEYASYMSKSNRTVSIIKEIVKQFDEENIIILGRYSEQVKNLKNIFGRKINILKMSYDGKQLLGNADVFIGSGGTMTAESALLGIPTISYNAVPNIIENYLVKNKLVKREKNPQKITKMIKKFLEMSDKKNKNVTEMLKKMEDPIQKLLDMI